MSILAARSHLEDLRIYERISPQQSLQYHKRMDTNWRDWQSDSVSQMDGYKTKRLSIQRIRVNPRGSTERCGIGTERNGTEFQEHTRVIPLSNIICVHDMYRENLNLYHVGKYLYNIWACDELASASEFSPKKRIANTLICTEKNRGVVPRWFLVGFTLGISYTKSSWRSSET
jgi:hypothetical protein